MKISERTGRKTFPAVAASALLTASLFAAGVVHAASSVSESAPARTGQATVPTEAPRAGTPAYPSGTNPSGVNESSPATAGRASTPTRGQGQSAVAPKAESMNRLPETPSSVSESAPSRTGRARVPTAPAFDAVDLNRDGVLDRSEYDRFMQQKKQKKQRRSNR